jgi:hypothetical protein
MMTLQCDSDVLSTGAMTKALKEKLKDRKTKCIKGEI